MADEMIVVALGLDGKARGVYGEAALVPRCRAHKVRNVLENRADKGVRDCPWGSTR